MSELHNEITDFNQSLKDAKNFAQRLAYLLRLKNLTGQQLAEAVNVSKANVSTLITGKVTNPPATTVLEIARVFQVDPEWLVFGTGSPERKTFSPDQDKSELLSGSLELNLKNYGYIPVRVYSSREYEIVPERLLQKLKVSADCCCISKHTGDDMEPVLCDGDSILIQNFSGTIINGSLYALATPTLTICRRLFKKVTTNEVIMRCENRNLEAEIFSLDNSSIKILGQVIAVLNRELR